MLPTEKIRRSGINLMTIDSLLISLRPNQIWESMKWRNIQGNVQIVRVSSAEVNWHIRGHRSPVARGNQNPRDTRRIVLQRKFRALVIEMESVVKDHVISNGVLSVQADSGGMQSFRWPLRLYVTEAASLPLYLCAFLFIFFFSPRTVKISVNRYRFDVVPFWQCHLLGFSAIQRHLFDRDCSIL